MATYKVLQDIEAEDKLLGPLTLKQFIFAGITIVIGFIQFKIIVAPGSVVIKLPFILLLLVPMLIFGFLAAPIGRDQPNDVWLLARLRFFFKPHRRIWDQNGMSQLVTITVPKLEAHTYTNNLSQTEVKSRLSALANTLDSRGWAIKNVNVNLYSEPNYLSGADDQRLVDPTALPQDVPISDIQAAEDIFDEDSNPTAQHLEQMMEASEQSRRQSIISQVSGQPAPGAGAQPTQGPVDYWFLNQPSGPQPQAPAGMSTFGSTSTVTPGSDDVAIPEPTKDEQALITKAHQADSQATWAGNMHKVLPLSEQKAQAEAKAAKDAAKEAAAAGPTMPYDQKQTETAGANPAILELASNDDLNVATIARQANRITHPEGDDGEVVISLR